MVALRFSGVLLKELKDREYLSRDLEDEEELAMGRSEKNVPGRGNSMGKDFEARPCLVCSEPSREAGAAGTE